MFRFIREHPRPQGGPPIVRRARAGVELLQLDVVSDKKQSIFVSYGNTLFAIQPLETVAYLGDDVWLMIAPVTWVGHDLADFSFA